MTADAELAAAADEAGVDRVGLDLEHIGKFERQGAHSHLRISQHRIEQLPVLSARLARAQPFVRCNPLHPGSSEEVERALAAGAQVLMLPYFRAVEEVATFVRMVRGRAFVSLLLETPSAAENVAVIARARGVGEIMVGLNDLALAGRFANQFALLASPLLDRVAREVRRVGVPFGFGGLADPANRDLPVPPSLVFAQYARLGATSAFVARRFAAGGLEPQDLADGIRRCRSELDRWSRCTADRLEAARCELARAARSWARSRPVLQHPLGEPEEHRRKRVVRPDPLAQGV